MTYDLTNIKYSQKNERNIICFALDQFRNGNDIITDKISDVALLFMLLGIKFETIPKKGEKIILLKENEFDS